MPESALKFSITEKNIVTENVHHSSYIRNLLCGSEYELFISMTYIFNIYFLCYVVGKLSAFIFIVFNFLPYFPYFA